MKYITNTLSCVTQLPTRLVSFIRESYEELRKVSWPSRETTIRYTVIVIVSTALFGALTGGVDYLLTLLLEKVVF